MTTSFIKHLFVSALGVLSLSCGVLNAQEVRVVPVDVMPGFQCIYPTVWDSMLVFSSNKKWDLKKTYFNQLDRHLFQLFKVPLKDKMPSGSVSPYFGKADKGFNMFSASFASDGTSYISQNNMNASVIRGGAPIGVYEYASEASDAQGQRLANLPVKANCGMASVSDDGQFMVFASDMLGGEGRVDLYYCVRTMTGWSEPCNLGANVNTPNNETAPFVHPSGKIFFASDGRSDSQGLDIYYTYKTSDGFAEPIKFDEGVNGPRDDYGFYYSPDEKWGYFASTRDGKDKLFFFERFFPEFENCDSLETMELCYSLYEESAESYDTTEFSIKWTLGDGTIAYGPEVEHCYPGVGTYQVELSVLDKTTGEEMFSLAQYELDIVKPEQLGLVVPEVVRVGVPATFSVSVDGIPFFRPKDFYWDFGNGEKAKGAQVTTVFSSPGVYRIECGTIDARNDGDRRCTWVDVEVK